jgi:hypothetical protein
MALRCRVAKTTENNGFRPQAILWEGTLVWEDPDKPDDRGNPGLLLKVNCGLRDFSPEPFLTLPQQMEAYVDDNGKARQRAKTWVNREGKKQYTPLVALGRGLAKMGVKAVLDSLEASRVPTQDMRGAASSMFDGEFSDIEF